MRPQKRLTKLAPARAAMMAWLYDMQHVQLTSMPRRRSSADDGQLVPADRHLDVEVRVVAEVADELLGLARSSRRASVVKTSTLRGIS